MTSGPISARTMRPIAAVLGDKACLVGVPCLQDQRGMLRPFDFSELPFRPRRMFVVSDVPAGTVHGEYAQRTALQMLVCLSGVVEVELAYRDQNATVTLDSMDKGLVISPKVWAQQTYVAPGSQLLVLASEAYDEDDYIYDRDIVE